MEGLSGILSSTSGGIVAEIMGFFVIVWAAFLAGVVVGWIWRPRWVGLGRGRLGCFSAPKTCDSPSPSSPSSSIFSPSKGFGSLFRLNSLKLQQSNCAPWLLENKVDNVPVTPSPSTKNADCSLSQVNRQEPFVLPQRELEHLYQLVEVTDGGPSWIKMMDRSTPTMSYQAWRRDPEVGPPQYRSRTVFEDAMPELVRDFFWDDEFRSSWDDMLLHSAILEECPSTGSMVVHWVRKFPFFCSDREYIIARRIWKSAKSYFCVTKGIPYPSIARRSKPRRVDLYYSSWCIRAVNSRKGDGQPTACEVILFHHEDMGIPWEIAKLGVRQGMWGAVRKIEPGLRAYQKSRASDVRISRTAFLAQINTEINPEYLRSVGGADDSSSETGVVALSESSQPGSNIPKFLIVGGAVLLACSLDHGLLTKAAIFGVARRFSKIGKRL